MIIFGIAKAFIIACLFAATVYLLLALIGCMMTARWERVSDETLEELKGREEEK